MGSHETAPYNPSRVLELRVFQLVLSYSPPILGDRKVAHFFCLCIYASDLRARAIAASTCCGAVPPVWFREAKEPSSVSTA